jgi:alanine dehydrogenase
MQIGVLKEIKPQENRVGLVPASVRELIQLGHSVFVEQSAGLGIGMTDADYQAAGAVVVDSAEAVFEQAELIIKVKEPQPVECKMMREGQTLFTYLHLAADSKQAKLLMESGCTAIAYETVTDAMGELPLLTPMSQVAGRMSIQAGAHCLEKPHGGSGILLGGVPGVASANVVIIGGGVVGINALRIAIGMEANVTVLEKSLSRLRYLDIEFGAKLNCIYATTETLEQYVRSADLVIGAVLVPGAAAPKLVSIDLLRQMRAGSVIVDVAIDQGGCVATSRPTTYEDPTFVVEDIIHYCVANMPGGVPRTSTLALNNATLPFIIQLAQQGVSQALLNDEHLLMGLNINQGQVTHQAVAQALGCPYVRAQDSLS